MIELEKIGLLSHQLLKIITLAAGHGSGIDQLRSLSGLSEGEDNVGYLEINIDFDREIKHMLLTALEPESNRKNTTHQIIGRRTHYVEFWYS